MFEGSNYMKRAYELADKSNCKKMHFGAVIVKEGEIISEGYNHLAHECLKNYCNPCIRVELGIKSGTRHEVCGAIHAEEHAIINAKKDLTGATLYLGGKLPDGTKFIKEDFWHYCTSCTRVMAVAGIENLVITQTQGETEYTLNDYLLESYKFALEEKLI